MEKPIEVIVATSHDGGIGFKGTIPWKLKGDLKRFKELTMGNVVIMGRKTVESLPGPLLGRTLLLVSASMSERIENDNMTAEDEALMDKYQIDDVCTNLTDAIALGQSELYPNVKSVFIAGGARIYAEAIPLADVLHITWAIPKHVMEYDTVIPNFRKLVFENFPDYIVEGEPSSNILNNLVDGVSCLYAKYMRDIDVLAIDLASAGKIKGVYFDKGFVSALNFGNKGRLIPPEGLRLINECVVKPKFLHIQVQPKMSKAEVLQLISTTPNPDKLPFKLFPEPAWFDDLFDK